MKKIFLSLVFALFGMGLFANTIEELNLLRYDDIEYLVNLIMNSYCFNGRFQCTSFHCFIVFNRKQFLNVIKSKRSIHKWLKAVVNHVSLEFG